MVPETVRVYSEDATFQQLEALRRSRSQRNRQGAFLVEGVRQIDALAANDWRVRALLYPYDAVLSDWAQALLARGRANLHYALPMRLHSKLSSKNETSELLAVVDIPRDDPSRIVPSELPLVVVADRSGSPGNLGTLIRSCDALGVDGVVMTGHSVDLYDPQTIAASVGSLFSLPVVRLPSHRELAPLFERIREEHGDLQVIGTSAAASRAVFDCNFWRPTILLLGNEKEGLSASYRELADVMATIPMLGTASSLNVACAASILLYEVQRQRAR